MRSFRTKFAGLTLAGWLVASGAFAQPQKKYKDDAEHPMFDAVAKDITANNFAKAVTDLDAWKQKYPDSEFKDDRALLYVQAYNSLNQPGKAIEAAGELVNRDLDATFAPQDVIKLLFNAAGAITRLPNATAEQIAIGQKAARQLQAYNKMPPGVAAPAWDQARAEMQRIGKAALMYTAMLPGNQAMGKQPRDCAAAETAYSRALQEYPDNAAISYNLGTALSCLKRNPEAIYEFQRAVVLDASLSKTADAKQIEAFADNAYVRVHGSDEGLRQLKEQVKQSPLPPAGFTIKTATEIAAEKEAEFEKSNPQLAMWMKIKGALSDNNGDQYFEGQLKNAAVPQLKGVLVEGKPACKPKELLVAVPLPDAQGEPRAEITLKLDKALTGKPDPGADFRWEGVPTGFARDPFMLTMDVEAAKVSDLKVSPCTAAAPPAKKAAPKKK